MPPGFGVTARKPNRSKWGSHSTLAPLMKLALYLIAPLFLTTLIRGEDKKKNEDPFDLTTTQKEIATLGIPTKSSVESLETKALELYRSQKSQEAIDALDIYARNVNFLANLVAEGLQPYYNQRGSVPPHGVNLSELGKFENLANELKKKRDRAWIMEGECYYAMGDKAKAVALLETALDHMNSQDVELWTRARELLYQIIEINPK